jgi:hypothetical protein
VNGWCQVHTGFCEARREDIAENTLLLDFGTNLLAGLNVFVMNRFTQGFLPLRNFFQNKLLSRISCPLFQVFFGCKKRLESWLAMSVSLWPLPDGQASHLREAIILYNRRRRVTKVVGKLKSEDGYVPVE